ncbi:hypothetical protein PI126_g20324 [Phytophthora idaei]|nr:hypothetical protein PI126_g20324 [Phytophthora idaei]
MVVTTKSARARRSSSRGWGAEGGARCQKLRHSGPLAHAVQRRAPVLAAPVAKASHASRASQQAQRRSRSPKPLGWSGGSTTRAPHVEQIKGSIKM